MENPTPDISDNNLRADAMLHEFAQQRDLLGNRAAQLAAELAISQKKVKELEERLAFSESMSGEDEDRPSVDVPASP